MDQNLIYTKTASGEEAVRQRTRVVQRNTRMVLILVDGNSTVGELCQKTGNEQLVESALQELERDGLIVPKLEQDSVWEQSRKLAEEIKAAAVARLAKEMPREAPIIAPQTAAATPEPFSVAPMSMAPFSTFGGQVPHSMAPFSTFGPPPVSVARELPAEPPLRVEQREAAPSPLARLFSIFRRREEVGIAPVRRGTKRTYISLPLALAFAVCALAGLLLLVFLFYPYDSHKPQAEAVLSRLLGQPVRIAALKAELSPRPGIVLSNVSSDDLQLSRVRLVPEVFSLFGAHPVFSLVEIDGASVSAKALTLLPKAAVSAFASGAPVTVRSLRFSGFAADVIGLPVGGLQGELQPDEGGRLGPLTLITADRSFKAVLQPDGVGFSAKVDALAWQPAPESRFRFDALQADLSWNGQQLVVRSLDARIFDGSVQGVLTADLQSGRPGVSGDIVVKRVNLSRLGAAFGYGRQYEGELAGALRFSGRASSWGDVLAAAAGEGSFELARGTLGGFDLVEAVRRSGLPVRGGAVRYEQLTGTLRVSSSVLRFSDLALSSGLLRATGQMQVDGGSENRVAGRLDVEMRGSANVVRMPVTIGGSLKDPVMQGGR